MEIFTWRRQKLPTPARGSVAPSVRIIVSTTPSTIYSGSSTSASNVTSSSSSLTTTSTSTCVTASPKSRKRKRRSKQWARKKMKAQRNSGKEYTSAKKLRSHTHARARVNYYLLYLQVNAKKFSPTPCACKLKCCSRITTVQRNTYLITSDFNAQNAYLCGCIKVIDPKRRYQTSPNSSRHQYSRVFYKNRQGVSVRVCKSCFYVHLPFQMGAWTEH